MTRRLVLPLAAALALGCELDPETEVVRGTSVDHGAALFDDPGIAGTRLNAYACSTCHDVAAPAAGAVIKPGAHLAGVVDRPAYWGGAELELLRALNHCLYYFMLRDAPLSAEDEEAKALYAYLASLPAGPGDADAAPFTVVRAIDDLPAGDAGRGAGVYQRACEDCHGGAFRGDGRLVDRAPILPQQTLEEHPLGEYTDVERRLVFVEKVRHGGFYGYGGQMPPLSLEKLPDEDLAALLAFLELY